MPLAHESFDLDNNRLETGACFLGSKETIGADSDGSILWRASEKTLFETGQS